MKTNFLTMAGLAFAAVSGVAANIAALPMGVEVFERDGMTVVREVGVRPPGRPLHDWRWKLLRQRTCQLHLVWQPLQIALHSVRTDVRDVVSVESLGWRVIPGKGGGEGIFASEGALIDRWFPCQV
ncbi:hypothetical protein E4U21_003059 [Claviceps maximensis]|nr:hypothetical protein E4U21_003059 [Claviceps maximensis]